MKFKIKISLKNNYCKHTGYWLFNRSSMQSSIRWSLCNNRIVSVGLIIVPPAFKNPTKLRRYVCLPVSINSGNWIEASNMTWIIQVVQEFFQQKFFGLWNLGLDNSISSKSSWLLVILNLCCLVNGRSWL